MPRLRQNGQEKTAPAPTRWVGGDSILRDETEYGDLIMYTKNI